MNHLFNDIIHFKASRPRAGMFCLLLMEARPTTTLELPDHEHTFVVKCAEENSYSCEGVAAAEGNNPGDLAEADKIKKVASSSSSGVGHEFVIRTHSAEEMRQWLSALQTTMRWPMASATLGNIRSTRSA